MVKVSITLPNAAQITLESEEPEVLHEVVGMALRDLPRDLMRSAIPADGGHAQPDAAPDQDGSKGPAEFQDGAAIAAAEAATPVKRKAKESGVSAAQGIPTAAWPVEGKRSFADLCNSVNPLGDMRKVVVAAEAARRFLGLESVDAGELAALFDLAGWRQPHSFTQTLRNAARDKFRWLERLPGRKGRYAPTDLGRAVTLRQ